MWHVVWGRSERANVYVCVYMCVCVCVRVRVRVYVCVRCLCLWVVGVRAGLWLCGRVNAGVGRGCVRTKWARGVCAS